MIGSFAFGLVMLIVGMVVAWNFVEQPAWLAKHFTKKSPTPSDWGGTNEENHKR